MLLDKKKTAVRKRSLKKLREQKQYFSSCLDRRTERKTKKEAYWRKEEEGHRSRKDVPRELRKTGGG